MQPKQQQSMRAIHNEMLYKMCADGWNETRLWVGGRVVQQHACMHACGAAKKKGSSCNQKDGGVLSCQRFGQERQAVALFLFPSSFLVCPTAGRRTHTPTQPDPTRSTVSDSCLSRITHTRTHTHTRPPHWTGGRPTGRIHPHGWRVACLSGVITLVSTNKKKTCSRRGGSTDGQQCG